MYDLLDHLPLLASIRTPRRHLDHRLSNKLLCLTLDGLRIEPEYIVPLLMGQTILQDVSHKLMHRGQRIDVSSMEQQDRLQTKTTAAALRSALFLDASLIWLELPLDITEPTSSQFQSSKGICYHTLSASYHTSPSSIACKSSLVTELTSNSYGKGECRIGLWIVTPCNRWEMASICEPESRLKIFEEI